SYTSCTSVVSSPVSSSSTSSTSCTSCTSVVSSPVSMKSGEISTEDERQAEKSQQTDEIADIDKVDYQDTELIVVQLKFLSKKIRDLVFHHHQRILSSKFLQDQTYLSTRVVWTGDEICLKTPVRLLNYRRNEISRVTCLHTSTSEKF